jgi:hypothetical protein
VGDLPNASLAPLEVPCKVSRGYIGPEIRQPTVVETESNHPQGPGWPLYAVAVSQLIHIFSLQPNTAQSPRICLECLDLLRDRAVAFVMLWYPFPAAKKRGV